MSRGGYFFAAGFIRADLRERSYRSAWAWVQNSGEVTGWMAGKLHIGHVRGAVMEDHGV